MDKVVSQILSLLGDLRFLQHCCQTLHSSGIWCCVDI